MVKITYISHAGEARLVEAASGQSAMEAAVHHNIAGIDGDCGGVIACGTCHVHVDGTWTDRLAPPGEKERDMLAYIDNARPNSRLCCQIVLGEELDGLVLHLPIAQH
ncbi:2Fe-2S iron-sulfur cluster-binding protein [Zavarzinia aquatilis]|uniref:2Fe-2S ferredoxin n=1 Tax=Zavarzinia aquatilis TaxID=2211142 RepID=A0A317EFC8_9PROT|nr:2Fe-2S iron-sulfur cluster-binding protein [Zavarzinia aquatilis]PWR25302.1 2Fe-2S ferredoxin [Zavarzinia aquatilis]